LAWDGVVRRTLTLEPILLELEAEREREQSPTIELD
jgi:hypothetical protein